MNEAWAYLLQAQEDYETAQILFKNAKLAAAAFFCHQACEKALKAFAAISTKEEVLISHSLIYLGKLTKIPETMLDKLKRLNPSYTLSRYPTGEGDLPSETYTEEDIDSYLKTTKELLEWIKKQEKK